MLVYWRRLPKSGKPDKAMAKHSHDEVCAVSIGAFKKFAVRSKSVVWHYEHAGEDYSENPWIRIAAADMRPGQTFLVGTDSGGYSNELGWHPDEKESKEVPPPEKHQTAERGAWVPLADHSAHVHIEAKKVLDCIPLLDNQDKKAILDAALHHDLGKSHPVFQNTLVYGCDVPKNTKWAKSPNKGRAHERKNFRHEVASALAYLEHNHADNASPLVAYLIASHHGKVRLAMRSPVSRLADPPDGRYLLGFKTDPSGDEVPESHLGDGTLFPCTTIRMGVASIGLQDEAHPSWLSMAIGLRDEEKIGPFRLAYLEALVRAADVRASAKEDEAG